MREKEELAEELREFTALKYAGDCKCGKCQLVPRELVDRVYAALRSPSPVLLGACRQAMSCQHPVLCVCEADPTDLRTWPIPEREAHLTVKEVEAAHAQFGQLDKEKVKAGMGANWPAHWDQIASGEGIFAATPAPHAAASAPPSPELPAGGRAAPVGYLLAKAGINNGHYFIEPAEYAHVEERFRHVYTPVYALPAPAPHAEVRDHRATEVSDAPIGHQK